MMQVSLDSKYVAVADLSGDIFIYKMQQNENNQWILNVSCSFVLLSVSNMSANFYSSYKIKLVL